MVVPVYVSTRNTDKEVLVYALLDTQSDTTFVSEETVSQLVSSPENVSLKLSTMSGTRVLDSKKYKDLEIRGLQSETRIHLPTAYSKEQIPMTREHIPTTETARQWPHLSHLVDKVLPLMNCEVGLLVGVNCPRALAPMNLAVGKDDEPFGIETALGWSIVGGADPDLIGNDVIAHRIVTREVTPPEILQAIEEDFSITSPSKPISQEDRQFLKIMEENIHRNSEGFYEMPLPFKERPKMPNNRQMAEKRLEHLKKKFKKDKGYYDDYKQFITKVLDQGAAEEVPVAELHKEGDSIWYLPHHGVYNPRKPEKIRVVFDASASYCHTVLNDKLLQGPDLINSLPGVLTRFRRHPIALTCDIESMFHRFKVNPEDRDFLRFLWWSDGDTSKEVKDFRMTVHLFGARSSPACANFALRQIAKDHKSDYNQTVYDFISKDFYVDDGLHSSESVKEAIDLAQLARQVCASGKVRLHKFASNSREVMEAIPDSERSKEMSNRDLAWHLPVERTLGVEWNLELDSFQFRINFKEAPVTRRNILSSVASIYDPLGFLAPVTLVGKRIVQQLCVQGYSWDDPVPEDIDAEWHKWKSDLVSLKEIIITRCYKPKDFGKPQQVELHNFSDASIVSYGQCTYIRQVDVDGNVHCSLVMAKSRVAPTKVMTIPRLELTAAVLSTKMSRFLNEELDLEFKEFFWTDSKVVLGYIANESRKFHVFVANRIERIKESSTTDQWRHVSSEENPADLASRGSSAATLGNSMWFKGPDFIWEKNLPVGSSVDTQLDDEDPEVRVTTMATSVASRSLVLERIEVFSSWSKAISAIARLQRAARREALGHKLASPEERLKAERFLVLSVQRQAFQEDFDSLQRGLPVKSNSVLYSLNPSLDQHGLIRVGGRLTKSNFPDSIKHPVILPKEGHVTKLIIRHMHEYTRHQGRGITQNETRSQGYWIISGSKAIQSYIRRCVFCRKSRRPVEEQKMADLPEDRVDPTPPFTLCGMDVFGPFMVKRARKEYKRYGLVITCLCCRGIHIEMLEDMTTDCFLNALRSFIAIRGAVKLLRSDQGSNFVGARNELREALKELDLKE